MKTIWESIKAIFAIRKLIKNFKEMNLETIRKIWVLIGSIIASLSLSLPPFIEDLFGTEGTNLVFALLGAGLAVFQFVKSRVGSKDAEVVIENAPEGEVQKLSNIKFSGKVAYLLNPFASGPKKVA